MDNVASLLAAATTALQTAGITEARREASALLAAAIFRDRTFLIAHPEYTPDQQERLKFLSFVERRAGREPFHYITRSKEFYGLDFRVSPAVLIPRPETEMLVEQGLAFLSKLDQPRFCEVGVGSGCISLSLLFHAPSATAVGLEISAEAIVIANENATTHKVDRRFDLRQSDLFDALVEGEKFDLIVSNPPYIPLTEFDELEADVRKFEPMSALTDGADGLQVIKRIVAAAPSFLDPGGRLMIEFGFGQAEQVKALFGPEEWSDVVITKDFQGIPRSLSAAVAG